MDPIEGGHASADQLEIEAAALAAAAETAARLEAEAEVERLEAERVAQVAAEAAAVETERNEILTAILEMREWHGGLNQETRLMVEALGQSMLERLGALELLILALPQVVVEEIQEEEIQEEETVEEEGEQTPAPEQMPSGNVPENEPEPSEKPEPAATKKRHRPRF